MAAWEYSFILMTHVNSLVGIFCPCERREWESGWGEGKDEMKSTGKH